MADISVGPVSWPGWLEGAVTGAGVLGSPCTICVTQLASLAISAHVNVLALQRMLGHASAAMTLDTYADLFDKDLDAVGIALHEACFTDECGQIVGREHRGCQQQGEKQRPTCVNRWGILAEAEGFEPPVVSPTLAFKASAFGRSATLPSAQSLLHAGRRVVTEPPVDFREGRRHGVALVIFEVIE